MGFTPNSSPKGGPTFNNSPQTTADLNELRRFTEERGNYMTGTSSDRLAVTGSALFEGLTFYETDTDLTWIVGSSGWKTVFGDTGWITPTLGNGWVVNSSVLAKYRRLNGVVYMQGRISGGTTAAAFTLPAGFRPPASSLGILFPVVNATGPATFAMIAVNANGTVIPVAGQVPNLGSISFIADS